MTVSLHKVDKSTWDRGPWDKEPDYKFFEYEGLPCIIRRGEHIGSWCGYVAVPLGHPWHGVDYGNVDANVHGGLTYSDKCQGHICHIPKPGEADDVWWLGFDCGHSYDLSPAYHASFKSFSFSAECVYRDMEYVLKETVELAKQAKAAANG